jgi:predicted ATPase
VAPLEEATLQHGLAQLVEAELLYQRGRPPQATYLFKHALVQEAAYQSLLRSTRQQHHQRIAQVLETQFPDVGETQPELLAQHYTEAGLHAQAVGYWQRAGQRAIQRSAHVEAISHLGKGLEVLKTLPDTPEHTQQELILQTALGQALMVIKGQAAPDVEQAYTRARELCRQVGETPQLVPVLWGLWYFYLVRGEFQTARELGEQLLTLTRNAQDPALRMVAHRALGNTLFWLGEFAPARAHLEQGIALYNPQQHGSLAFVYGQDLAVTCRAWAALTLWLLGYPDQALESIHGALSLARELAHPLSLAYALDWAAMLHRFRREADAAQEHTAAAITLSTERGFAFYLAWGTILHGWALAEQGQGDEGIAQICRGLAAYRAIGGQGGLPYHLAQLAEGYSKVRQTEEGLRVLAEALTIVETTEERCYEAELYRLKGELLLAATNEADAEACFHQALDIARRQQAKSWELRAAVSLSRLWRHQGKRAEAHALLAPIYGWFTEGFDTADLREAKMLLEELG